jgi:paired small multidrug resistance pump
MNVRKVNILEKVILMNRSWLFVLIAAVIEVFWVSGLKYANNYLEWTLTIIAIVTSFCLLTYASRGIPVGTLYATFTGVGTAGTVLAEMLVFGEPFNIYKIILIATLLSGVIGLKLLTSTKNTTQPEVKGE